jgi:uncharacterized membrane protein
MIQSQAQSVRSSRHRGVVFIYSMVMMAVLIGLCSLAVDFGHIQIVNIQLQRAADAAAMAGAQQLPNGNAAVNAAALAVAQDNSVDTSETAKVPVPIDPSLVTVQYINWVSPTNYHVVANASSANAVSVTIKYNTPMMCACVLGFQSHTSVRTTIAQRVIQSATQYVSTNSNPWLAGEPLGTQGSEPDSNWDGQKVNHEHPWQYDIAGPNGEENSDGEPYESPVQVGITVTPGSIITISQVSGQGNNDFTQSAQYDATGTSNGYQANYDDEASNGVAEHGIADATMPLNSLNAVFLGATAPDKNTPPATLDFSTQSERDYTSGSNNNEAAVSGQITPKTQQVFYVGNGLTSKGTQETIVVPQGATRMFLGTMDGHEWSNNEGGFTATVSETYVEIVK